MLIRAEERREILENVHKLMYTYGLNKVIRYEQVRNEVHQTQSVAEHVTNMLFCAYHFRDIEDPEHRLNFEEIIKMILMHDMGEIETGDIVTNKKTKADTELEYVAIKSVKVKSPNFVKREVESIFERFEEPQTPEERFAKAIDKFEGTIFWFTDDGIKMIKSVSSNDVIQRYFERLESTLDKLGFINILKYIIVMKDDMISRGLLA